MKISVKESTMLKPAAATPQGGLWLSNVDLAMHGHHTATLYFYKNNTKAVNFFDSTVLKAALSRVLVAFYPAAGRLRRDDNGRIEVNCNGEGVLFVEAECDSVLDDLGEIITPNTDINGKLVPSVDYTQGISTYPLWMLQVTRFKCGGVSIGIRNQHYLSDGFSALHLINTLAEVSRGLDIAIPPVNNRTLLRARDPPHPHFDHIEYHPPPPMNNNNYTPHDQIKINAHSTKLAVLKLTRDHLNSLKASCNKEDDDGKTSVKYSSYEVLAAHLWRCVCKARGLPEDQETKLRIPIDGRRRLKPTVPRGYFGNVIFQAGPVALCGEIQSKPLKHTVSVIHESIAQIDDAYLRSALDYLELQPDISAVAVGEHTYSCPNLGINSWARLPFYDADFGWGRPIYVGHGGTLCEGKCIILPSPTNDDSLLVSIALPKQHLELFEKYLYDI